MPTNPGGAPKNEVTKEDAKKMFEQIYTGNEKDVLDSPGMQSEILSMAANVLDSLIELLIQPADLVSGKVPGLDFSNEKSVEEFRKKFRDAAKSIKS